MSGRLSIHKGMLSQGLIDDIKAFSRTSAKHRLNLTSWDSDVVGWSGSIILFDVEGELKGRVLEELRPLLNVPDGDYFYGVVYTLGSRLSFIPWHNDADREVACTIYLNSFWDKNWAGAFIYEDGDECRAVYPEYNCGVVFKPPLMHTTVMPAINAPLRESLQVFATRKEKA